MYLYETHCHTSQSSKCGHLTGAELVSLYAQKGYQGIVITDHFYGGNTAVDRSLHWKQWVNEFVKGYENAREEGEKIGLQVFFGLEFCYRGTEILTYGVEKDWLVSHPEFSEITVTKFCEAVHEAGGILVHAHPFRGHDRTKMIRLLPNLVDGVEVVNKCNDPKANFLAEQFAENFGLMKLGGTDFHKQEHISLLGGVAMPVKVNNIQEIFSAAKSGKVRLL